MPSKSLGGLGRLWSSQACIYRKSQAYTILPVRTLTTTSSKHEDVSSTTIPADAPPPLPPSDKPIESLSPKEHALLTSADPNTAFTRREERVLMRQGRPPIGSRRRRAAVATSTNIPFEQLPYQCFQEARKVLLEDRQKKIKEIEATRARIERVKMQDVGQNRSALQLKERRLMSMLQRLEKLKVLADINDPLVKKRFEDREGDMTKPVYRHLARQKFLERRYLILKQRLSQMHVYPDLLPPFDISYDVGVSFGRKEIEPGAFVHSAISEQPPRLTIQPFDKGQRYVTIVVIDPDVPNVEADKFDKRCHFMAVNVPVSPTDTRVNLAELMGSVEMQPKDESAGGYENKDQGTIVSQPKRKPGDVIHPWLPPYAQKGSPYHRLSVLVLQQVREIDVHTLKESPRFGTREAVSAVALMRSFYVKPVGGSLFRTEWDSGTDALMVRMGNEGIGEELKRRKVEPLPYKWKPSWSERYR